MKKQPASVAFVKQLRARIGDRVYRLQTADGRRYLSLSTAEQDRLHTIARALNTNASELLRGTNPKRKSV